MFVVVILFILGLVFQFLGALIAAWWITKRVYAAQLPLGIPGKVLEYPIWAVLVGLAIGLIVWGGLPKKLGITSPSVVAQAPLPRSYDDLLEFLHQTHDVTPFGYD